MDLEDGCGMLVDDYTSLIFMEFCGCPLLSEYIY
jgi:hypothetical protein